MIFDRIECIDAGLESYCMSTAVAAIVALRGKSKKPLKKLAKKLVKVVTKKVQ